MPLDDQGEAGGRGRGSLVRYDAFEGHDPTVVLLAYKSFITALSLHATLALRRFNEFTPSRYTNRFPMVAEARVWQAKELLFLLPCTKKGAHTRAGCDVPPP